MPRHHDPDAPDETAQPPESTGAADDPPVAPEQGEGPIPPVAGEPRPPIGN
ncbi:MULTISPECIES: hypothetical protein [unclassified Mycobacterium]|uniref:hypothetical protein n=1 Tax=unclassified Mycobacterium TaxID=2642494 RepID=UPI000A6BE24B|nr:MULTISPECIES: hypothetical protein [unclassified Mycobacterium]